ncbi:hypothetical protein JTB14_013168 [Gonioctena quinquepunctata]|nr:hypothetical protein JTB14_013168 [Gonioctena quinquepunctata]
MELEDEELLEPVLPEAVSIFEEDRQVLEPVVVPEVDETESDNDFVLATLLPVPVAKLAAPSENRRNRRLVTTPPIIKPAFKVKNKSVKTIKQFEWTADDFGFDVQIKTDDFRNPKDLKHLCNILKCFLIMTS